MNGIDDLADMFFNFIEKQVMDLGRKRSRGGNQLLFASLDKKNKGGKKRQGAALCGTGMWWGRRKFFELFLLVGGKTHCASIAARASDVSTWET